MAVSIRVGQREVYVSIGDNSEGVPLEEAHSSLEAGLECCRAVVRNYRSLLSANCEAESFHDDPGQPATMNWAGASDPSYED